MYNLRVSKKNIRTPAFTFEIFESVLVFVSVYSIYLFYKLSALLLKNASFKKFKNINIIHTNTFVFFYCIVKSIVISNFSYLYKLILRLYYEKCTLIS